jgi:hypothetical protein
MGNVLSGEKREQVLALGRLGWPLRRIEGATGVRRETAGDYLRKAGIVIRPPGSWGEKSLAKAATQLITGSDELSREEKAKAATLGDHRLFCAKLVTREFGRKLCQRLCDVSGEDRSRSAPWPERDGHLAGSGRSAWIRRRLSERQAVRAGAARSMLSRSTGDHRNHSIVSFWRVRREPKSTGKSF